MKSDQTQRPLYIPYSGPSLIGTPLLNKGSGFTREERAAFNLTGLLPPSYESIEEQVERCYDQYSSFSEPINKHIYLRAIQDNNETLFYRLIHEHIDEMMPIIYTPTVGDACEQFSDIYRNARGLFIAYSERDNIDDILRNATKRNVKVIVVTDGERILGLGDQGIGGMGIPIGKLSLYTACGGISPGYTLPIMLDVGTNNQKLLDDPRYMGCRHNRIPQDEYDEFIEQFMQAAQRRWPGVLIQFEDFAQQNATPILNRYRGDYCCFNDDIQGTATVTVGTLLAACRSKNVALKDQKVVFVGGGSAGCGIAEMVVQQMCREGLSETDALANIFMIDRLGLMTDKTQGLRDFQQRLVQNSAVAADWNIAGEHPSLLEVVENAKPGIMVGVSGQAGLFTEEVIKAMHRGTPRPIVFPLSNPSRQIEAHPKDVIEWTRGDAIVATGSPFQPIPYEGKEYGIPQCNNSYIFPGIGLGVLACKAELVSDAMLMVAAETLAENSPKANTGAGDLLPPLTEVNVLSKKIAFRVAKKAMEEHLALVVEDEVLSQTIDSMFWYPQYRPYRRVSS